MRFRVFLAALLIAVPARAQNPPDPAALAQAQELYERAAKAMDAKDYATACPELEEVVRLVPSGVGGRITLGECYEGAGKLASAEASFSVAEALATQQNQPERVKKAHDRATALRPRLAKLAIEVAPAVRALPGLEIRRDGVLAGPAQWSIPLPVDRGAHAISATAAGKQPWQRNVEVVEDGGTTTVTVDALVDAPAVTTVAPPPLVPPPRAMHPPRPEQPPPAATAWGPMRVSGVVVGSVGLAALIGGIAEGAVAISKNEQSNAGPCGSSGDPNGCSQDGLNLRADAIRAGNAATGLFVAGGAAAAVGIGLIIGGASKKVATALTLGPASVGLRGSW